MNTLATIPAPMLLRPWSYADPHSWLIQEKLDGCRLLWDGEQFTTRSGRVLTVPDWFRDGMPDHPLDGELWFGRGALSRALSAVAGGPWVGARYAVFDAPVGGVVVEERLAMIASLPLPPHAFAVEHSRCTGSADMEDRLDQVARMGGEGIVLRMAGSYYVGSRSGNCRKLRL